MDEEERLKLVSSVLGRNPEVVAGYLMTKDMLKTVPNIVQSDNMVIGIVVRRDIPRERYPGLRSRIFSALSPVAGAGSDVIVLNGLSAALKYNVLQQSDGIYASSLAERVWFEERTIMEYFDFKMAEEQIMRAGGNG